MGKAFPIQELVNRECFQNSKSASDSVLKLLEFFGTGSVDAWSERYNPADFYLRHSPSHKSNEGALTVWLRLGELEAERQICKKYNKSKFKQATAEIRKLRANQLQKFCYKHVHCAIKQELHLRWYRHCIKRKLAARFGGVHPTRL